MNVPRGVVQLLIATIVIVAIWLVVLPRVSDITSVRNRIDSNRAAGINPTAIFYTDHPGMAGIERTIQARVDSPSGWFWKLSR
jgi:hypothetical protein